jgi:AraC-like DNA-binding protein
MAEGTHLARLLRSAVCGVEAIALTSSRSFPRHAHDQFGVGILDRGAHRSWSGIGPVEATAGDIITVNPGEMHDGSPVQGRVRAWRMLYFDPGFLAGEVLEELPGTVELARPAVRDAQLAGHFNRLFSAVTALQPEALAVEQDMLRTVMHLLGRYGSRPFTLRGSPPFVTRALQRLDAAPELPVTLAELAALSGVSRFQLIRGFARWVGTTPHAYVLQKRVRLARRLLAVGRSPAEAAAEAGFADQSHLTRAFTRQLGITPARYRATLA